MINEPSIEKLTSDGFNRYQICIATSKVARKIIDEWQEEDRAAMYDDKGGAKKTVHDDKPVKTAVHALDAGEYRILEEGKEDSVEALAENGESAPLQE